MALFFDNIGNMLFSHLNALAKVMPRLWNNLKATFVYWFTPLRVTIENGARFIVTLYGARDWFVCAGLALIPCDWQELINDGKCVDVPLFGNVNDYPLTHYFTKNKREIVGGVN